MHLLVYFSFLLEKENIRVLRNGFFAATCVEINYVLVLFEELNSSINSSDSDSDSSESSGDESSPSSGSSSSSSQSSDSNTDTESEIQ